MGVPAHHREPARSGEAGGPPWRPRAAQALAPRAGCWFRGVPERYVAGCNTRGRQASGSESLQLGGKDGHIRGPPEADS